MNILKLISSAFVIGLMAPAASHASNCSGTTTGFTPISDLGAATYNGFQGGLYPGGTNFRPDAHESAGLELARSIGPINANGRPDPAGKYVLLSIGMSNAKQEFDIFLPRANTDPAKDSDLLIVNGSQGGATAFDWANPSNPVWADVMQTLSQQGASANQVVVVWAKFANSASGEAPGPYRAGLQGDVEAAIGNLRDKFPNLKLVYLASRTYAGYATSSLNPEPQAYESGFVMKWIIEKQLDGDSALNFDPTNGPVKAPWLSWGPYFWADGLRPRGSDGLTWRCSDFREDDGTHPSDVGMQKVAAMLLEFFKLDVTAREWFLADPGAPVDRVAPMAPGNLTVDP